jgi:hypothetical protein
MFFQKKFDSTINQGRFIINQTKKCGNCEREKKINQR